MQTENLIFRVNTTMSGINERWIQKYKVGTQIIEFLMDTGAAVNCIPISVVKALKMNPPRKSENLKNLVLVDYNNRKIKHFGHALIKCIDLKTKSEHTWFEVLRDTWPYYPGCCT